MTQQDNATNIAQQGILVVPPSQDFISAALQGSIQQILAENLGKKADCEFLVGSDTTETKSGILQYAGNGSIVLYDEASGNYLICDACSIKFATLYPPQQAVPERSRGTAPTVDDATKQPATEAPQSRAQGTRQTPAPEQPMQISGVQPVNARTRSQAAFNYAKRKARR